jgi:hypothetical protein
MIPWWIRNVGRDARFPLLSINNNTTMQNQENFFFGIGSMKRK